LCVAPSVAVCWKLKRKKREIKSLRCIFRETENMCVCEREREKERESARARACVSANVCVCVCVYVHTQGLLYL